MKLKLFFIVLVSVISLPALAYTAFGHAGDNQWFGCGKAKDSALIKAKQDCMAVNKVVADTLFGECKTVYHQERESSSGTGYSSTYTYTYYLKEVRIDYTCR